MSITKDTPVPTSYHRMQEHKPFGIHLRLLIAWGLSIFLVVNSSFLILGLGLHRVITIFLIMVIIVIFLIIIILVARDIKTLDKSWFHLLLLKRIIRNKNITKVFVDTIDDLKKIIPLDTVEDTGLIRYTDHKSGILVRYDPPRISVEDNDFHSAKIKNVINSLHSGFTFQFIANSIMDIENPLSIATKESMKSDKIPKQIVTHLHSLFTESQEQKKSIEWEFILLVTIPVNEHTKDAEKIKDSIMPGLLKELKRADINARVVEERNESIKILRNLLC